MTDTPPSDFEPGEGDGDEEMDRFLEPFLKDANDIGIVSSQFQESGIKREDITDCDEADLRELLDSIGIAVKYRNRIVRGMRKTNTNVVNNNSDDNQNPKNDNNNNNHTNNRNNNNATDLWATDSRLSAKEQALMATVAVKLSNVRRNVVKVQTAIADVAINKQQIMDAIQEQSHALTEMVLSQIQIRVRTNIETTERISAKKASLLDIQLCQCQEAAQVLAGIQDKLMSTLSGTTGDSPVIGMILDAVPGKLADINTLLDADLAIQANDMILEYKCDEAPLKQLLNIKNSDLDSVFVGN